MATPFSTSTTKAAPISTDYLAGFEPDGSEIKYQLPDSVAKILAGATAAAFAPNASGVTLGASANPFDSAYLGLLNQTTSTSAAPTTTEYPANNDWGIHHDTNADSVFLTYNKSGSIISLDLENAGGGIDGWSAGAGNALVPDVAGTDIGAVGNEAGRIYVNKITQTTSTAAPASLTEYPNANDWGIHHDTNTDTVSLAYNKAGAVVLLDLENTGGIDGWAAGAGNALVPNVAGTVIGAVGNEAGRIYGNNIIDLTAAGGAAQVLGPGGYSVRPYGGGVSLLSTLNIVSTLGIGTAFGNAKLTSSAADILEQRNSTNAQEYRLYNTYTDASNYERGELVWDTNKLYLRGAAAGTGTLRNVQIGSGNNGYINIYEIGDSSGIDFGQGGSGKLTLRSGSLRCQTPGAVTLGEAGFEWGDIYSNGDIYLRPSSSLTPSSNGDLVIEATNDTTLTFKLKGSDGTVRSGTVALS